MSHVDLSVFTPEDYTVIRNFVGLLDDLGVQGAMIQEQLYSCKHANETHLEPLKLYLSDVTGTEPENMHEAAMSFVRLVELFEDPDSVLPEDFMPSLDLQDRLVEQYWNYHRDRLSPEEPPTPATGGSVLEVG